MIYSACCKSVHVNVILKIYLLCLRWRFYVSFLSIPIVIQILPSLFIFFDEPRSISDLGLNRDLRTIEYGQKYGNIT